MMGMVDLDRLARELQAANVEYKGLQTAVEFWKDRAEKNARNLDSYQLKYGHAIEDIAIWQNKYRRHIKAAFVLGLGLGLAAVILNAIMFATC